jgi:hypothetical protein
VMSMRIGLFCWVAALDPCRNKGDRSGEEEAIDSVTRSSVAKLV